MLQKYHLSHNLTQLNLSILSLKLLYLTQVAGYKYYQFYLPKSPFLSFYFYSFSAFLRYGNTSENVLHLTPPRFRGEAMIKHDFTENWSYLTKNFNLRCLLYFLLNIA